VLARWWSWARSRTFSRGHGHLVDSLIDAYVDWREECAALEDAYRRWVTASGPDAGLAFAAYRAGLDREEHACLRYGELVRRAERALPNRLRPRPALAGSIPPA
jgi:hypothetical protein